MMTYQIIDLLHWKSYVYHGSKALASTENSTDEDQLWMKLYYSVN